MASHWQLARLVGLERPRVSAAPGNSMQHGLYRKLLHEQGSLLLGKNQHFSPKMPCFVASHIKLRHPREVERTTQEEEDNSCDAGRHEEALQASMQPVTLSHTKTLVWSFRARYSPSPGRADARIFLRYRRTRVFGPLDSAQSL